VIIDDWFDRPAGIGINVRMFDAEAHVLVHFSLRMSRFDEPMIKPGSF